MSIINSTKVGGLLHWQMPRPTEQSGPIICLLKQSVVTSQRKVIARELLADVMTLAPLRIICQDPGFGHQ